MASYWIVVPRGNEELFELLSVAFRGRTGFAVIEDRRTSAGGAGDERRSTTAPLGPNEIVIAERADAAQAPEGRTSRRVATRPPRYRRTASRQNRDADPLAAARAQRLLTL